jgi:hypothetical protein
LSTAPNHPATDKSLGELVGEATRELSTLFRTEVELARTEIKNEVAKVGQGAGLFASAGVFAWFGVLFLSAALALGLWQLGLYAWAAALIVGLLYAAGAAVLALVGKKRVTTVRPPERTIITLKEDVAWVRSRKS